MTPITPKGTVILRITMPFGRVISLNSFPRGDGSEATFFISPAIPARRSSVSFKRSYFGFAGSIRDKSSTLAAKTSAWRVSKAEAVSMRMRLMVASSSVTSWREAARVCCNNSLIMVVCSLLLIQIQIIVMYQRFLIPAADQLPCFRTVVTCASDS